MKRPQTKFYADTMSNSKVIRSKKFNFDFRSQFIVRSKFFAAHILPLYRYFIKATTTNINMLLQV